MSQVLAPTLQNYLDYALRRNSDEATLEDLEDNFKSVVNALTNLSANPDWPHYLEETRITTKQPLTYYLIVLEDGSVVVERDPLQLTTAGDDFISMGVDDTWVLKVDGEDTEYPIADVVSATELELKYPYVNKGVVADLDHAACKLIKRFYALPENFRELLAIKPASSGVQRVKKLTPSAMLELSQAGDNGGMPEYYVIQSKPLNSQKVLRFYPYVDNDYAYQYDLTYQRWPAKLVNDEDGVDLPVDWPPELRGVLEKAIEVEIHRKNKDVQAEQQALIALAKDLPGFKAGGNEDVNFSLRPIGEIDDDINLDRIQIDSSDA